MKLSGLPGKPVAKVKSKTDPTAKGKAGCVYFHFIFTNFNLIHQNVFIYDKIKKKQMLMLLN